MRCYAPRMKFSLFATPAISLCLAAFAPACGGGHEHAHGPHEHGHHEHEGKHRKHHDLKGGMKAFHDVLAPIYHAEKSPARDDKACGAMGSMRTASGQIGAEPAGDAAAWKAKSDALTQALDGLDKACQTAGKADVAARLEVVHDAFHALMAASK